MPLLNLLEPIREIVRLAVNHKCEVLPNDHDLNLQTLIEQNQSPTVLRLAFDRQENALYVQDGVEWYQAVSEGDESSWTVLNAGLRYLRKTFGSQPALRFGEPPGTQIQKKLSEFPAWFQIRSFVANELKTEPKDIAVVEYVPYDQSRKAAFYDPLGAVDDVVLGAPGFFINRNMGPYGQPDYDKVNKLLVEQYLKHTADIHPEEFKKYLGVEHQMFFAVIEEGKTKLFKATHQQAQRLTDEDSIQKQPQFRDKQGPIVVFYFLPESKRIVLLNWTRRKLHGFESTSRMLDDIKRIISKNTRCSENEIIVSHNDMVSIPFVSKTSNYPFVDYYLNVVMGEHKELAIVECPLTKSGEPLAKLIINEEEEQIVNEERRLRINHGVVLPYPFIAVESRVQNEGIKSRAIIEEYTKLSPEVFDADNTGLFSEDDTVNKTGYINQFAMFMLEMGESPRSIIDFFAPRENPARRYAYMELLTPIFKAHEKEVDQRREEPIAKTASLDIGINDWQKYGLQEQLNTGQHTNNKQDYNSQGVVPYNLKQKKQQVTTRVTMEGLLKRDHDTDMNWMKSIEQLLDENRI